MIPPEVSNTYMLLGYAVVVLILLGLIGYFVNRARRLRAELAMLEALEGEAEREQTPMIAPEPEKTLVR